MAILVDDVIDTSHMLILAARTFHERGAKTTHVLILHGLCRSPHGFLEQLVVTNIIPQNEHKE